MVDIWLCVSSRIMELSCCLLLLNCVEETRCMVEMVVMRRSGGYKGPYA